jgi:D-psicose/D-tagatose/L-ribulose 3-epimerase
MFAPEVSVRTLNMFERARTLGLDGIELLLTKPASFPIDAARDRSRATGVAAETFAVMLPRDRNLIDPDPAVRHAGISLVVEPINRYRMYFINTAEEGWRLVDRVGLPNVGLALDTFHMNIEEASIGAAIRTAGERLLSIHLNENHRGIPGTGHISWPEVFAALDAIGYDGRALLESVVPEIPQMAALFTTWRKVAPSTEVLIEEGLQFFRCQMSARPTSDI